MMFGVRALTIGVLGIALVNVAVAEQTPAMPDHHHMDMASNAADGREVLHFPPEMRINFLRNMRDHMETVNSIVESLSTGDYVGASRLAAERLGLDSPSAANCKPKAANANAAASGMASMMKSSPSMESEAMPMSMDQMMAMHMPESMRTIGLSMHTAASEFADVSARAAQSHDAQAAMTALARITHNCVACHATYRLQ